jgi:hypothetical protein
MTRSTGIAVLVYVITHDCSRKLPPDISVPSSGAVALQARSAVYNTCWKDRRSTTPINQKIDNIYASDHRTPVVIRRQNHAAVGAREVRAARV